MNNGQTKYINMHDMAMNVMQGCSNALLNAFK